MKKVSEKQAWKPKWRVVKEDVRTGKVVGDITVSGNVILYQGLGAIHALLFGVGAAPSPIWDNGNAHIGVGNSNASSGDQSQTDLIDTGAVWVAMEATYPQQSGANSEDIVFRSIFNDGIAEFAWNEIGLGNAATTGGLVFNRLVQVFGNKAAGQRWTVDLTLEG